MTQVILILTFEMPICTILAYYSKAFMTENQGQGHLRHMDLACDSSKWAYYGGKFFVEIAISSNKGVMAKNRF